MNQDRHFYLYAKHHYKRTDIVSDLSVIYKLVYLWPEEEKVPIDNLIGVIKRLAYPHIKNSDYIFNSLIEDIMPENSWRVGYENKQNRILFNSDVVKEFPEYDVKMALLHKFMSILANTLVKDIPFELGEADDSILPLSDNLKKWRDTQKQNAEVN